MISEERSITPYLRALIASTHLGSLLTLSELLHGRALAFAVPLLAGGIMLLLSGPLASLFFKEETCDIPRGTALLLSLLTLLHAGLLLWVTTNYLSATFLHHTPRWGLILLLLGVPVNALWRTEGALMRLARLIFPVTLFMLGMILFYQTQWDGLLDILTTLPFEEVDTLPLPAFGALVLVYLNPAVATPMLFAKVQRREFVKAQRQGTVLSALLLSVMLLMPVTSLGVPLYETLPHPLYSAGNAIIHGTPLLRVDTLLSTVALFAVLTDLSMAARTVRVVLRLYHIGEGVLKES